MTPRDGAKAALLSGVIFFGSLVSILDDLGDPAPDYSECALALPPHQKQIVREFERFMKYQPGLEFYIQFNEPPPPKEGWQPFAFSYKSYRVFVRRAA